MTIIVTKPGITMDVVGSYFYDENHDRNCMTFFGPSMTKKIVVEARARKISQSSWL